MNAIEFINVKKTFQDGDQIIEALKTTNFSVKQGEFVAVIGPSGSGKSTFLTIAGGLQTPSEGQVLVNGKPLSDNKEKIRANIRFEEIGFILQSSKLIPFLTVEKQLILVDKIKKQAPQMTHLFKDLGIEQLTHKYPEDLSGGEKQRVAIARALYNNPSIILADEPTASLDTKRAYEVVQILAKETKEKAKATIMVTHDLRMIASCDRVLKIEDGFLSEINDPNELEQLKEKLSI